MGADKSAENTPNTPKFICPSTKVWDFDEKRLHRASVVRGWRIWRKLYILRHLWTSKSAIFYWLCKLLDLLFLLTLQSWPQCRRNRAFSWRGKHTPVYCANQTRFQYREPKRKSSFSIGIGAKTFFNLLLISLGDISFLSWKEWNWTQMYKNNFKIFNIWQQIWC